MSEIVVKTPDELACMRDAGRIVGQLLELLKAEAAPGVTTRRLDELAEQYARDNGATPTFKGYRGFPASVCASINEQVVHGIPGRRRLREGDILSIDVGVTRAGFVADAAVTVAIGESSPKACELIRVTKAALESAIAVVRAGVRVVEISRAIQQTAESSGFSVVRQYTGHGIGRNMHEDPQVPNFVDNSSRSVSPVLPEGATIAIEPMINAGTHRTRTLEDGWTVVTADGSLSAHFEHTVAAGTQGAIVLTRP